MILTLKGAILGAAFAAATTPPGDVEDHVITLGRACAIVGVMVVATWKVSKSFNKILGDLEQSKLDRAKIAADLKHAKEEQKLLHGRVRRIYNMVLKLRCHPGNGEDCPLEPSPDSESEEPNEP